jgi:DNA-directed RNA polymerase specialized sigma24 family protein
MTSLAERDRCAVAHPNEREAVRLLADAGWTHRELAMVFDCSDSTIARILSGAPSPEVAD